MTHVDPSAGREHLIDRGEAPLEEGSESHVSVVGDRERLGGLPDVVHAVRRIGEDDVDLTLTDEPAERRGIGRVPAPDPMVPERPDLAGPDARSPGRVRDLIGIGAAVLRCARRVASLGPLE